MWLARGRSQKRRGLSAVAKAMVVGTGVGVAAALAIPPAGATIGDSPRDQLALLGQAASVNAPSLTLSAPLKRELLASAAPDECFGGVGEAYGQLQTDGNGNPVCPDGQQLKVNQAYVWGLAQADRTLWFGTGPNINCLATSQFIGPMTSLTDSYVCEGAQSKNLQTQFFVDLKDELVTKGLTEEQADNLISRLGDWRAPDLFTYDLDSQELVQIDGQVTGEGAELLARTVGIRSAGAIDDFVIFAGPDIASAPNGAFGSVNVFVFKDGQYLGAESVKGWTNIRKWVEIDGALYTGVATTPKPDDPTRGEVLKFLGSDENDVVQTEVVGTMTSAPSEFTKHEGRVYTTTWPTGVGSTAGIWMSPPLGDDGLAATDAGDWSEVWNIADYEPDPVIQQTTALGPIESLDGKLFWGTMNVPFVGGFSHGALYNQKYGHGPSEQEAILMLLGGHRATAVFRGGDFDAVPSVELLYGSARLPVAEYDNVEPVIGTSPVRWRVKRNQMGGQQPLYGPSGFGNPFNAYTWTMAVNRGDLYVGTFDDSYLISSMLRELQQQPTQAGMLTADTLRGMLSAMGLPADGSNFPWQYGADMFRFADADSPAVPEFINGADNRYSYGIRTMISDGDNGMYLGMANPMNLEVSGAAPQGGWQLVKVSQWPTTIELTASQNPIVQGDTVRLTATVLAENRNPAGNVVIRDGSTDLGMCVVTRLRNTCSLVVPGLTAGSHEITASFHDGRTWASSTSVALSLTVNPPAAPDLQAPAVAPQQRPAATPQAPRWARSAARAVKPLRTSTLVRSNSSDELVVRCFVKGRVLTGNAARRVCGTTITVTGSLVVQPKCTVRRIEVTVDGAWTRTWTVVRSRCKA